MKFLIKSISVLVFASLCACSAKNNSEVIQITGSSTIAPLISEIAKQYESVTPGVRIDVQAGGSSKGIMDVRSGVSDIGMVSRKLKSSESDVNYSTIGSDGLAIIVNKDNPLNSISSDKVIDIYKGNIDNWSAMGWDNQSITVVNKAEGHSTLGIFLEHFNLENREIKADVVIGDNQQGIQTVAGNPNAIGYVSIGTAEYEITENHVPIKLLVLDGVAASTANLINGSYSISRELNLTYKDDLSQAARRFIDYVNSDNTVAVFKAHSFIKLEDNANLVTGIN